MSQLSLRRTLASTAATALVVAGAVGFVGAAAGADPTAGNVPAEVTTSTIPAGAIELNNATAGTDPDCPDDGYAYWHFILASTGNGLDFTEIHLELAVAPPGPNDLVSFSGGQLVPNAGKGNNVFVAVPAGHTTDDIVIENHRSYAFYAGTGTVVNFTLSHICDGVVPTTASTSSTSSSTTSTSTTSSSTTSTSTTSTSTTSSSTTSTSTTSTSTTSTTTTSTSTTSTTAVPTTSTAPTTTPTTPPPSVAPTTAASVLGTVQTQPEAAAVEASGELPYTGSNVALLVVSGLCVLAGGAALVAMARTGRRATDGS